MIDVYSKDPVGGRLATVTIGGKEYETGGSILHPKNHYMIQFVNKFGKSYNIVSHCINEKLTQSLCFTGLKRKKGISGKLGLYDGSQFLYKEGSWHVFNVVSLLWRYGISLVKMDSAIGEMLNKFDR